MDESLNGLSSLLATIHGLYPQARVTSGYRGPNNPLTLRNPASLHAQGSPSDPRAVDVAPIPGVSFGNYVNSIKQAGVPVGQAFDEATHPYPWTTGPNWHIATGAPQVAAAQRKPPTLAGLMGQSPNPVAGGVDPLAPTGSPTEPYYPAQQPTTLADLGTSRFPVANGVDPLAPQQQQHSKFSAGNILGVLGDALSAYGGKQPTFGPFLREQQMVSQQQNFEREKFQQELAMKMYAMTHPEEMLKAQAFQAAPQPVRQSMVDYENTMHPNVVGVQQPNGSIINQVQPRQLNYQPGDIHPGTDGNYRFKGGDPTNQASWEKVQ